MDKILVIPDVHGRSFWRKAKEFKGQIVFLGDYHDPYFFEFHPDGPYKSDYDGEIVRYYVKEPGYQKASIDNFRDIIEFANANKDRVTLLLGNHDWHYIYPQFNASRRDEFRQYNLAELYKSAEFKRYALIGNTLFTHAGLSEDWLLDNWGELKNPEEAITEADEYQMFQASGYRGGSDHSSSPLWLDYHEIYSHNPLHIDNNIKFQVFSHSQLGKNGDIKFVENGACIDSREIFEIDPENPKETLKVWQQ